MLHIHPLGAGTDISEMLFLQIGRERRGFGFIAAGECLPGKVIVPQRKIAGQPTDALKDHIRHCLTAMAGQRRILRRRNAQAVERDGVL